MEKPSQIFGRDEQWRRLTIFTEFAAPTYGFGVVSGRRRQGKTFLLQSLVRQTGGFYFGAQQATETDSLRMLGDSLAEWTDAALPPRFTDWNEAVGYLFRVGAERKLPLVIDEFPYLSKVTPALPSILQNAIDRCAIPDTGPTLLVCGSAMSVMGKLLSGSAPLRGRASLELILGPFDFPTAARYWNVNDPRLAVMLHSVVGGTPAYRTILRGDVPQNLADFDSWVARSVLSPHSPIFREARYLLEEDTDVRDTALYHSVLAAIANGNNTRGGIASYIGKKSPDIGHHLNVLEDSALIRRAPDLLHANRTTYRLAEPLIAFYQAIMRPYWGQLESGYAEQTWNTQKSTFSARILGPHFEQLAREWVFPAAEDLGWAVGEVGAGTLTDHTSRQQIELDVVVLGPSFPGQKRRVLALGEAKWGEVLGNRQLARLRRAAQLLEQRGYDTTDVVFLLFSGAGFDSELPDEPQIRRIGLKDLYVVG